MLRGSGLGYTGFGFFFARGGITQDWNQFLQYFNYRFLFMLSSFLWFGASGFRV